MERAVIPSRETRDLYTNADSHKMDSAQEYKHSPMILVKITLIPVLCIDNRFFKYLVYHCSSKDSHNNLITVVY